MVTLVRIFSALFCLLTCSFYPFFLKFLLLRQRIFCQMGCISVSETGSRLGPGASPCELGYRPSGSTKGEEFLNQVWATTCFSQRAVFYGFSVWLNYCFYCFEKINILHLITLRVGKKNQLDVTECFIALMICSTCFGHFYVNHQELETICVLLPPMVCSAWLLVVGGQV